MKMITVEIPQQTIIDACYALSLMFKEDFLEAGLNKDDYLAVMQLLDILSDTEVLDD